MDYSVTGGRFRYCANLDDLRMLLIQICIPCFGKLKADGEADGVNTNAFQF